MGGAPAASWPLTAAQHGVWIAQSLAPADPVFNTADAVELHGPVDARALAAEIRRVLNGAQALHVRFVDGPDGPRQVAVPDRDWPLPIRDLRGEPDPAGTAEAFMTADLRRPVDLQRDRLFATALLRTGEETWTWYLRIHHIATDAYATALLMRRVAERCVTGLDPAAPLSLGDLDSLVEADRGYATGPQRVADRDFWQARLTDHVAPPTMAGAVRSPHPRPEPEGFTATSGGSPPAARPVRARRHLATPLAEAAHAIGASWPDLLIAGVAANLQSLTREHRQVFAMPVLARGGPVRRTPGIAVNIVPLIVEVDPLRPLHELVGAVRDELRATRRHQRLRFEEMARLLPAGTRLFGPQINLKPYASALRIGAATGVVRNLATGPVDDLSLIVTDLPDGGFDLMLDGHAGRYTQDDVEAQLDRLVLTLEGCAAAGAAERPVGALPTITASERRVVVARFNDTAHIVSRTTITALLREQAARTPGLPAVTDEHETITYAELHARAESLAAVLAGAGAGPGRIVGLALQRSVGLQVAVLAVLLAGGAYLPLDPELPPDRLDHVVADGAPACIVISEAVARLAPALAAGDAILIDDAGHLVEGSRGALPTAPLVEPTPEDLAYVIYTSGSTGRPKGVLTEHAALVNRLEWMSWLAPIGPGDVVLQKTPFSFDVSVWELTWPLLHGARTVMAAPGGHRDPAYLAELIERERVTLLHFVPSMLELFLEEPAAVACGGLRHVICSGEALPESTVARYHERFSARLHNLYGPTEAAIDVTAWTCDPADPPGPVPIGSPIWNTRTYVLDEALRPVPVGAPGELWLAGTGLAREYAGRPDLTAERFVHDPLHDEWAAATGVAPGSTEARMYRTGDLARWRPDGALEYLGRSDDQVKLRGQRIELGEIEATLARHPLVARAAASLDRSGVAPRIVAHVVAALPAELPVVADLRAHLMAALPEAMVPSAFGFVEDLPLSPNGKLDRRRLPALPAPGTGHGAEGFGPVEGASETVRGASDVTAGDRLTGVAPPRARRAPASLLEQSLCELFAEVLGLERFDPAASLFDLGGDSLRAARLAAMVRARLGVPLQLGALFADPTPRALVARIDAGGDLQALEPLLTLRAGGDAPPLFCLHPAGGVGWCYAGLARTITDRPILALQAPGVRGEAMPPTLTALAERYADLVEEAHPTGLSHLLGWSIGGVLAQETAAVLQARGRRTGVVALLDAFPGEQWAGRTPPTREDTLLALLHMGGLDARALDGEPPTPDVVLAALAREGSALAGLGDGTFEHLAATVLACSHLMQGHRTRTVDGDLLFFLAAAPRAEDWLDATAWQHHATGRVLVETLDCTHPELPRRGLLDRIGERVAEALAAADGDKNGDANGNVMAATETTPAPAPAPAPANHTG